MNPSELYYRYTHENAELVNRRAGDWRFLF